jgi:hypothetical protein
MALMLLSSTMIVISYAHYSRSSDAAIIARGRADDHAREIIIVGVIFSGGLHQQHHPERRYR